MLSKDDWKTVYKENDAFLKFQNKFQMMFESCSH